MNEGDKCRTVWIILKRKNWCRDTETVSLEINDSVLSAVAAASMAYGYAAVTVTTSIFLLDYCKSGVLIDFLV